MGEAIVFFLIAGLICVKVGLMQIRDKERAWEWKQLASRTDGLEASRTREWESWTTFTGYITLFFGIYLLGAFLYFAFGPVLFPEPEIPQYRISKPRDTP